MSEFLSYHSIEYVTSDQIVRSNAVVLHKLILHASTDGGSVSVFEGSDPTSGRLIGVFEGLANQSNVINFDGIRLERGLYLNLNSNMSGVSVVFDPYGSVIPIQVS